MHEQRRRWMIILIAIAVLAAACTSGDDDEPAADEVPSQRATEGALRMRLSEGAPAAATDTPVQLVTGTPLDDARVAEILDRLPALTIEDDDRQTTSFPAQSLRPPVVGQTVAQVFPATADPAAPPAAPTGPLEVLRRQPDGDVDVAPFLSITFDQPMVPVATLDELDAADVPVTITPELPGRWRWIGTRTLRFEHDPAAGATTDASIDRLPMATEYTVTIPAGTTSATGNGLAEDVTWTFRTPPVTVASVAPVHDALDVTPIFVATFDQVVDADAVMAVLAVTAGGDDHAVRRATDDEIDADDAARQATSQALPGRWLAFRPVEPFPSDAAVVLTFPSGTPSAEGRRTTEDDQSFRGRTYGGFTLDRARCGWGSACQPGDPFFLEMSNPVDAATLDPDDVEIRPEVPGLTVHVDGHVVVLAGDTSAETGYEVTLPTSLRDTFGQQLGGDRTVDIRVGTARPALESTVDPNLTTVDPLAAVPSFGVHTIGHDELRLRTFAVGVDDYADYQRFLQRWDRDGLDDLPDWSVRRDETISTTPGATNFGETTIDLAPELGEPGHVVVVVEPTRAFPRDSENRWANQPIVVWVQRTDIGLDALADAEQLVVWATDLRTGAPIAGVDVALAAGTQTVRTGADGLATARPTTGPQHLVATKGADSAILVTWETADRPFVPRTDVARWHVLDDRGLYRPGETAHLKGWVRRLTLSSDARLAAVGDGATVHWTANDAFGNEVATGDVPLNRLGGFDLAIEIPAEANVGEWWVDMELRGATGLEWTHHLHQLRLAEFRRPEFEVTAAPTSAGPHLITDPATVSATAEYLSGGVLANAPVTWTVRTRPGTYAPPGWDRFEFGVWRPWWPIAGHGGGESGVAAVDTSWIGPVEPWAEEEVATFDGRTDATGTHHLRMELEGAPEGQPVVVSANAAVSDVNRQQLADTTDLLVHAASLYVGLRTERTFVDAGTSLDVEAIVTDIEGEAVSGRTVTVTSERLEWQLVDGEWTEVALDGETCEVTSTDEPVSCAVTPASGGTYRITGAVSDDDGGTNTTTLTRWVSGQGRTVPQRQVTVDQLTLVPDAETYADGDTAELLVQVPFADGTGLLTTVRNGITANESFTVADGHAVLHVPVSDDHVPGIDVVVEVVGATARTGDAAGDDGDTDAADLPPRPAIAVGTLRLDVPPISRTLDVEVTPAAPELTPGAATSVEVVVTDVDGAPVDGAELAVVIVDEAVLSLTDHQLSDPLASMYATFDDALTQIHGRRSIALARPDDLARIPDALGAADGQDSAGGVAEAPSASPTTLNLAGASSEAAGDEDSGDGGATGGSGAIDVRTDLDALVVFAPEVATDAEGRATVDVPLPDNLTRYRVMVTAVHGNEELGTGEANITARLPVQARPSAPRFANFGDAFELPVVIQNQTDAAVSADVVVEATNLTLTDAAVQVEVPANDRVEVRIPVEADDPGTARIRATVVAGDHTDATVVELPVHTPATAEAFATYGVIDDGAVTQPFATPDSVITTVGGLDVSVASTSLQTLTDAVLDLTDYRFEHVDAHASRVLAVVALRDVLTAFQADGLPSAEQLDARMVEDLAAIARLQNDDGGFGTWWRDGRSDPYRSIQATHALVAASNAGHAVDSGVRDAALAHVRHIEQSIPSDWPPEVKAGLSAYALHVRMLAGDRDQAAADDLYDDRSDLLGVDGLAWLWPVVGDDRATAIADTIDDRVTETPSAATFTTEYGESAHLVLASDRRTDGIVLDALIRMRPESDLIPKVVNGLIGNQRRGAWRNVQENSFILLAMKSYFDAYESATPDFVARVWLGDTYAAETQHRGRSVDTQLTHVAMSDLVQRDDPAITVAMEGSGRLYYRLGLRYAPDDLVLDPRDEGFVVDRTYEAVGDDDDVRRDADGTWHIRAGANVRVVLTMVADSQRTNMALIDPIPAGLEILNPDLATAADVPTDAHDGFDGPIPLTRGWWWGTWYDHQNQRDDRAEAFAGWLPAGTYEYSYVARATTPGTFVVPPARAEELYAPEVFGRSASATVVVDAPD